MTSSAKTLRALERAAMRWYQSYRKSQWAPLMPLYNACEEHHHALHAATKKGKK